jgi:hypothetical protein
MNKNGKEIVDVLAAKLDFDNIRCYDSNIVRLLSSLDKYELNELITFGTLAKWEREKTLKNATLQH